MYISNWRRTAMSLKPICRRMSLSSDPFSDDHVKKIRETHNHFPKPAFISFDLFGTLYTPREPVPKQYHDIATREFGIDFPLDRISSQFPIVYEQLLSKYPNYGQESPNISNTSEWWSELIVELLEIPHYKQSQHSMQVCDRLLSHFTTDEAYRVYDDVIPTLKALSDEGVPLLVSSNSDPRVYEILENLQLSQFFPKDLTYLSTNLGYEKPDRKFFHTIANSLYQKSDVQNKPDFLEQCWHVGDSYAKDFLPSVKSGWNGVLLDRHRTSKIFSHHQQPQLKLDACFLSDRGEPDIDDDNLRLIANNRVAMTDLTQLLRIFDFDPAQPSQSVSNQI